MTKVNKVIPSSSVTSRESDSKVTLFFNKETGTLCYKNEQNQVIEIGSDTAKINEIEASIPAVPAPTSYSMMLDVAAVGSNAPTGDIRADAIGMTQGSWVKIGTGIYQLNFTANEGRIFTENKTYITTMFPGVDTFIRINRLTDTSLLITVFDGAGVAKDGFSAEIKVEVFV